MPRDINLGPTGGPFINLQENNGDLDISNATNVDLNGANLTNANIGGFDSVEVFEADGTFDASNVDTVFVECVGGGGGGASVDGNQDSYEVGGGGGGGGYAADFVDVSGTSSVSVTVGDGGAGATSGNTAGDDGGNTSFGSSVVANGGQGGPKATIDSLGGGGGGFGGVGAITIDGEVGEGSFTSSTVPTIGKTSAGGDSYYGYGGKSYRFDIPVLNGEGGSGYGGGGAGAITDSAEQDGGPGTSGIVIVYYKA